MRKKRLAKFVSVVLSAAMVMTMSSVPTLAEEIGDSYQIEAEDEVESYDISEDSVFDAGGAIPIR